LTKKFYLDSEIKTPPISPKALDTFKAIISSRYKDQFFNSDWNELRGVPQQKVKIEQVIPTSKAAIPVR
jgi:hypothetical protein